MKASLHLSEQAINNVIILKQVLTNVNPVFEALTGARSNLLVAIRGVSRSGEKCWLPANIAQLCTPETVAVVQGMIDEVINEDIVWAKSSLEIRNQRCHAVKVCRVSSFLT